jgi:hypothetical protein
MTVYPDNLNHDEYVDFISDSYVLDILDESQMECCHHQIIEDYIDVDPEKSVKIFYCDTCYITVNEYDEDVSDNYTDEPPITLGEPVEFIPLVDN